MTVKPLQNTHKKVRQEYMAHSKLFHKCNTSIPPYLNLSEKDKYKYDKNKTPNMNLKNYKQKPNKYSKKAISIRIALKGMYSNIYNLGTE